MIQNRLQANAVVLLSDAASVREMATIRRAFFTAVLQGVRIERHRSLPDRDFFMVLRWSLTATHPENNK